MLESCDMKSAVKVSPVNMKQRAALGIRSGDTVRVWQNIVELKKGKAANKKEITTKNVRRQAFEGIVIAVKHGNETGGTFTVRKVASGVGVERIFPIYAPMIDEIEVLRRARTRRAKLYFIRRKAASDVKRAMRKQIRFTPAAVVEDEEPAASAESSSEPKEEVAAE